MSDKIIFSAPERETWMEFKLGKATIKARTGSIEITQFSCTERNINGEVTLIKKLEPIFVMETI